MEWVLKIEVETVLENIRNIRRILAENTRRKSLFKNEKKKNISKFHIA